MDEPLANEPGMDELADWLRAVAAALGVVGELDTEQLLDTARHVAHVVSRPATPLTMYLMGRAVGAGGKSDLVAGLVDQLADGWSQSRSGR